MQGPSVYALSSNFVDRRLCSNILMLLSLHLTKNNLFLQVPLKSTIHHASYHPERKVYVLATSVSVPIANIARRSNLEDLNVKRPKLILGIDGHLFIIGVKY